MFKKFTTLLIFLLATAAHVEGANILVPSQQPTINAALAVAVAGDVIRVAVNATYTECVVLPAKGTLATPITIRADTADGNLPAANVRINPTYASFVATIKAANTGCSAIETAVSARDYVIGPGIRLIGSDKGYTGGAELGRNTSSQTLDSHQPQNITLDRVWIQGDAWTGQKFGVDLNGKNLTVKNSYIEHITGVSQDAVGLRCFNGDGPITITNNYINAAGYGFICGGDQPYMMTFADASAATTSTATLTSLVNRSGGTQLIGTLHVGQYISVLTNAGTMRYHPKVISCGTSTAGAACTSANITFETIPAAPDTGAAGDIQWGSIPTGLTIRRNHFKKDVEWMNNILATPVVSSATPSTTSGSLPAGTYFYRVQATYCCYQTSRISSSASVEVSATLSATGRITLNWGAVSGPSGLLSYRIFRSTTSGAYAGYLDVGNVTTYTDTGTPLTGTSTPPGGSDWVMKNAMELKFAVDVQIDSNIFEHNPVGSESGYGIWLKSNNYGTGNYMHTRNVVIEKNILDGMDGCFSILGRIDSSGANFTRPLENLTIRNNACFDSNTSWMMGKSAVYAIKIQSPVNTLTIENNTINHTMSSFMYLDKTTTTGSIPSVSNFTFKNNIFRKGSYGVFGESCTASNATECFTEFVTGTSTMIGNFVGGSSLTVPSGNTLVPLTEFEGASHFVNYQLTGGTVADFALKPTSSWKGQANGGGDPGANISLIQTATTGVTTGAAEGTSAPDITTNPTLPSTVEDVAMTPVTLAVTGGTAPYTWSVAAGSTLPPGTSLSSSGVYSGTPTTPGTYNFSIRVVDSTSGTPLSDTQAFTLTVTASVATLNILTTTLTPVLISTQITPVTLQVTGGVPPYTWSLSTGSLPPGITLSNDGILSGTPTAAGTYNFTPLVTDSASNVDTQALSWVVNVETRSCGRSAFISSGQIRTEAAKFRRPTAPTVTSPDCATQGDEWFNTSDNLTYVAISTSPLVWALPPAGNIPAGVVITDDTTPNAGDLIVGNDTGGWTVTPSSEVRGLDAAAITTGVIDAARLPPGSGGGGGVNLGFIVPFHVPTTVSNTYTNMLQAADEFLGTASKRVMLETTNMTQVRLMIRVQGSSSSPNTPKCYPRYSIDGTNFITITGTDISLSTSGTKLGAWTALPGAAIGDAVEFSVWCEGGDGSADPAFGTILLWFK